MFELYNTDGRRTAYMDDNGNLTVCGIFKTGEEGENRVVIDGNGLTSFNKQNKKHGLEISGLFPGLKLYYGGEEAFEIKNEGLNSVDMYCAGKCVIGLTDVRSVLDGVWWYDGDEIANKNDIDNLQRQINTLKGGAQNPLG